MKAKSLTENNLRFSQDKTFAASLSQHPEQKLEEGMLEGDGVGFGDSEYMEVKSLTENNLRFS